MRIAEKAGIPADALQVMGGKKKYLSVNQHLFTIPGDAGLLPSDWKHVFDAIGLAQFAAEKYVYETTKARLLAAARS